MRASIIFVLTLMALTNCAAFATPEASPPHLPYKEIEIFVANLRAALAARNPECAAKFFAFPFDLRRSNRGQTTIISPLENNRGLSPIVCPRLFEEYEDRVFSVISVFAILAVVMAVFVFDDLLGIVGSWPIKVLVILAVLVVYVSPFGKWFSSDEKADPKEATQDSDQTKH